MKSAQQPNYQPDPGLSMAHFTALRDVIARYCGVYLDETRQRVLASSLAQRSAELGIAVEAYTTRLISDHRVDELQSLAELVLNHETVFFRNQPHFTALREVVLRHMHQRKPPGAPLKIWSAGCATGEEPYSLAITALEVLGDPPLRPLIIYGTDLSRRALDRAREGFYKGRSLNNVEPRILTRFFQRRGEGWVVGERVRSIVHFERSNLLEPFPVWAQGVDMIFCQNVTIYFKLETCRELMGHFYTTLPEGGMLFLGFSETLWNIFDRFESREIAGAFVYYKGSERLQRPVAPAVRLPPLPEVNGTPSRLPQQPPVERPARGRRSTPEPQSAAPAHASLRQSRELIEAGRIDEALEQLTRLQGLPSLAPRALALIARAHANRGDLDTAAAEARRAIELDPLTTEAYLLLGMISVQLCQMPSPRCQHLVNAARHLERARYLDPDAALVMYHLAEVYRLLGRPDAALREYRNTLRKLVHHPPDELFDGAAVGWVRETCQRHISRLDRERDKGV